MLAIADETVRQTENWLAALERALAGNDERWLRSPFRPESHWPSGFHVPANRDATRSNRERSIHGHQELENQRDRHLPRSSELGRRLSPRSGRHGDHRRPFRADLLPG